ncbi:L-serine ammonia-lyase [Amaricoccus sp.]|uniref:L-serine ammonia-lyase n=1 Tax=Amaricoccus sp. TaxID=1872485 RepID=UPI001B5F0D0A|nr:L-serine ammonia-lyase [Amaricoccus sp.]MBP7002158.1 L-serine ammonia-lyase [Amaricoccus sp.]
MAISVFDIYKIGVGPSSSHTFGPMVAAERFLKELDAEGLFERAAKAEIELYGSMALTGKGHFTDLASMLGLEGNAPATLDSATIPAKQARIEAEKTLHFGGRKFVPFDPARDIHWHGEKTYDTHPNGLAFRALDAGGAELKRGLYFSIGGGFVICEHDSLNPKDAVGDKKPLPYTTGAELAAICEREGKTIAQVVMTNELAWRSEKEVRDGLLEIAAVMEKSVLDGIAAEPGEIPGGLGVKRHAGQIHAQLEAGNTPGADLFQLSDYVNAYALAVMEVNACLGQVVTAPTMGASGIVPAVLQAYKKFAPSANDDKVIDFLLVSAGCSIPVKINASFSGAEVGCQGEVGSASLMAATGLAHVLGANTTVVLNAGAMALEHNLGLTCDPVKGLVQIPCIARNALAANKAINAVRLSMLKGDEPKRPTFDQVVEVLYLTGKDMSDKYKETSQGGLAVVWVDC